MWEWKRTQGCIRDGGVQQVMEKRKDEKRQDPNAEMTRHLIEAIEQVRLDMARVELWAHAVSAFARPVPDYDPAKMKVWLPREQATELRKPYR